MLNSNKEDSLTSIELEKQEGLSISRLNGLKPSVFINDDDRPKANFIDLMNWVKKSFSFSLKTDYSHLTNYIHNRIVIDGQFLHFCESNNIEIDCLYKDSIVSWKTDSGSEKFFVQGVFRIKKDDVEFIHAALFHKGNQNEDEISFFVVLEDKKYDSYISFRNQYEDWLLARDRSNLKIRVVDGEDLSYDRDASWEDIYLPEDIKKDIKLCVEGFLSNKDFYLESKIPWKRGILFHGHPGNGKTSIIRTIISKYNFKPVTVLPGANDESLREAFSYAEEQSPALIYFEDLDSLIENINVSSFLNLMDGISTKNGLLVIATANDIKKLPGNITDRPSRFDRKIEIPLPDKAMATKYLSKWFKNSIPSKKISELAAHSVKYSFSYGYLKELYVSSIYNALSNNRKVATVEDVNDALSQLMKDKNILKKGKSLGIDKYLNDK